MRTAPVAVGRGSLASNKSVSARFIIYSSTVRSAHAPLRPHPLAGGSSASADAARAVGGGKRLAPSLVAVHCAGIATDEAKIAHLRASGLFHDD